MCLCFVTRQLLKFTSSVDHGQKKKSPEDNKDHRGVLFVSCGELQNEKALKQQLSGGCRSISERM